MDEMLEINKEINFHYLIYYFKGPGITPISFTRFNGSMYTYNQLKNGSSTLLKAEEEQKINRSYLNEITRGNPKYKSQDQLYTIKNVKNHYNSRQKIINLLNDNSGIRSEAIYEMKQNETKQDETKKMKQQKAAGLKILTPKQLLQKLPKDLAQVKAGNNPKRLLNEIRQIVYSLYQSKEITKNVCKNIVK